MKSQNSLPFVSVFGLMTATTLWPTQPAQSQTHLPHSTPPSALLERKVYIIPLQREKPSTVLSWINPDSPPPPPSVTLGNDSYLDYRRHTGGRNSPRAFPKGLENIVADDAKHELLVFGTKEAAEKLAVVVRSLDNPLRHVMLNATILLLRAKDIEATNLNRPLS